ncbi:NADP-dependent isocitrate dehydrogenase [Aerophototrophica crusticola]|uniref:Isocitrate dehydrogenase [NADP] n=1 Tax=Aerophototrophica crusticola TaxID=1709002 RepID=A0A858R4H2_9PROT|nr:NADP-dependent isocitrate dehydrogenase [Rhodospirillaceae bacterium B3]
MVKPVPVTVAYGDGIGPEIMEASLRVLEAGGAKLDMEVIEIGEKVYKRGHTSGIEPQAWDSLRRTKLFYKAPITTPQGGGYKSLNVTIRKTLGLFANVRPCASLHPFVATKHPTMDVVIVRENEEDLYAGIEHRQTDEVFQCLKLITRPGCERIVRYAFEYARTYGRKKVTCFSKDNIMKLTDGLFHKVFDEVGAEYPDLEKEHWIVDIGAARLADTPEVFDVIVMPNLYGDILSDVAAQITGSVGLAGSANIGEHVSMFEAIHGSAPMIAGQDKANPSGLLLSGVMMLNHVGQAEAATRIHNAWLRTLEDGVHTADIAKGGKTEATVGTRAFAQAVIDRLGEGPRHFKPVAYQGRAGGMPVPKASPTRKARKEMVGVDMFVQWSGGTPDDLAAILKRGDGKGLSLQMVTNRGVKVWPGYMPETFLVDHWRCRFMATAGSVTGLQVVDLMSRLVEAGLDVIKTETLCTFDGVAGYSLGQGQ